MTPKFADCVGCKFFTRKRTRIRNPICGECDNGEFFEERSRNYEPSDEQLMRIYERMQRED